MIPGMPPPPIATDPIALQLLAAQQDSPLLVALFDAADQLQFANPAFRRSYSLGPDEQLSWAELMRKNYAQGTGALIQTPDFPVWLASARSRRGKLPFRAFECDLCDGRWMWMTETVRSDGWMLCVASDITDLKSSERALRQARDVAQRAVQTDGLTGISSRAHVLLQLEQYQARLRADQTPCGVVLLDLDYFKRVNDTYGHQAGDTVLQHFARTVHAALRREDCFGRVGGEEFLLLFPGMDMDSLNATVPRILNLVRDARPLPLFPDFFYTCSAGLDLLRPEDDARQAYQRVDEALYAAKAAGRDRCMQAV
jgi:diguanylate cyclase (GGDEF)-like protein